MEGMGCPRVSTFVTIVTTKAPSFDCHSNRQRWSSEQRSWCCAHRGHGCSSSEPVTTSLVTPSDCEDHSRCNTTPSSSSPSASSRTIVVTSATTIHSTQTSTHRPTVINVTSTSSISTTSTAKTTPTTTLTEPFDCMNGSPERWSSNQTAWCCEQHPTSCDSTTLTAAATPTTTIGGYNCSGDSDQAWSDATRRWCCKVHGHGCTECDVACLVQGFSATCRARIEWLEAHSLKEEDNACTRAHHIVLEECQTCLGCLAIDTCSAIANETSPHRCKEGDQATWSAAKRTWCCKSHDLGCPLTTSTSTTTTPKPYDCKHGASEDWRVEKQAWCCKHESAGCTSCDKPCLVEGLTATCRDRIQWLEGHDLKSKEDACSQSHTTVLRQCPVCSSCTVHDACPSKTIKAASFETDNQEHKEFNCVVGLEAWSYEKTEWCCKHRDLGCSVAARMRGQATSAGIAGGAQDGFDCQAGVLRWASGWSQRKKDFCCKKHVLGCPDGAKVEATPPEIEATGPGSFDCSAGVLRWQRGWSARKKVYCCKNFAIGCESRGTTTENAALQHCHSDHEKDWSQEQRQLCCSQGIGQHCSVQTDEVQGKFAEPNRALLFLHGRPSSGMSLLVLCAAGCLVLLAAILAFHGIAESQASFRGHWGAYTALGTLRADRLPIPETEQGGQATVLE